MDDVTDLRGFYAKPLGQMVRRLLMARIRARWPSVAGQRVLGVGFATPYLGLFREESERTLAFMPAAQGVMEWPPDGKRATALVQKDMWPLADDMMDRVLLMHGIEMWDRPDEVLNEAWRVLGPEGRLLAVVPSRRGIWARVETTPFGHGRPFSQTQLGRLLKEADFEPVGWGEALFFPPMESGLILQWATAFERFGMRFGLPFAGVHIVEAVKQLYRPIPARAVKLEPGTVPAMAGATEPALRREGLSASVHLAPAGRGRRGAKRHGG